MCVCGGGGGGGGGTGERGGSKMNKRELNTYISTCTN